MSGVDVNEVLNDIWHRGLDGTNVREFDQARAEVAHLIEKVEELLSSHGAYHCYGGAGESIEEHMRNDLVLALARVKGGE